MRGREGSIYNKQIVRGEGGDHKQIVRGERGSINKLCLGREESINKLCDCARGGRRA